MPRQQLEVPVGGLDLTTWQLELNDCAYIGINVLRYAVEIKLEAVLESTNALTELLFDLDTLAGGLGDSTALHNHNNLNGVPWKQM